MEKFCGKCGTKLDDSTGRCPNCEAKKAQKRNRIKKRAIIALILAVVLTFSGLAGSFAMAYQPEAVVHDYTQDGGNGNNPSNPGESGQEDDTSSSDDSNEAIMSRNVNYFVEDDAAQINAAISNIEVTNQGLYFDIAEGTPLENLGVGDIFYLEGSEISPLGQTYIGKIASVTERAGKKTYLIETPMVDEVFDVLKIDYSALLTAEDIQSIDTVEGVTIATAGSAGADVAALSDGSSDSSGPAKLANQSQTSVLSTLSHSDSAQSPSQLDEVTIEKELLFDINVDLCKVFGLKKDGYNGLEKYEYAEGSRVEVYTAETDRKYHKENCAFREDNYKKATLIDAVNKGYEPCFFCLAPLLEKKEGVGSFEPELKLEGQIGFESIQFALDYDWDIINGGGLEKYNIDVKGNFLAELGLVSSISLELGGETTTISVPSNNIKLQGLKEKLFPLVFVQFTGATVNTVLGGNEGIRLATGAVPFTVGALFYVDINGNVTVESTVSFAFEYDFDCSYTAVEDGKWVNRFEGENDPSLKFKLKTEVKGDADAHAGVSIVCYIFNLNIAELAVFKLGAEAEGVAGIEYTREFLKVSEEGEPIREGNFYGSAHVRAYLKLIQIDIKLKAKLKIFSAIDFSHTIDRTFLLLNLTLAEWGTKKDTLYTASLMGCTNMTAWDQSAVYYKDTTGCLVKEENGNQTVLYDPNLQESEFFTICGIDSSYIYITVPEGARYKIYRVSKTDGLHKVVAEDVATPLTLDGEYLYYVPGFDSTTIVRLKREDLKEEQFADFSQDVTFMRGQGDNFYVVTTDPILSQFWGGMEDYYLLDKSGEVLESYGTYLDVAQYHLVDYGSYYRAAKMVSAGFLRSTARAIYWMSKDKSSTVLTEKVSGWNPKEVGIFTTLTNDIPDATEPYKIVLYRAADGTRIDVTPVSSNQAFFTLCQSDSGDWYFFDQTDSEIILYVMAEDFTDKTVVKTFSRDVFPYDLEKCSTVIMNNRIYFFTMPNNQASQVIYRYDII